ncbi:MAG: PilZ domain-containing protein [Proteobacteria bacterium]|nr:PilZ domain-containing protein [Pseudomonadota bacterium]
MEQQNRQDTDVLANRAAKQLRVDAIVEVLGTGREFVFRTRDISCKGLFLYTQVAKSYPFGVGSELTLELYDRKDTASCRAVVVRVVQPSSPEAKNYPTGFGLRVTRIDEGNQRALKSMSAQ